MAVKTSYTPRVPDDNKPEFGDVVYTEILR